jgi:hypothetical protein
MKSHNESRTYQKVFFRCKKCNKRFSMSVNRKTETQKMAKHRNECSRTIIATEAWEYDGKSFTVELKSF